MQYSDVISMKMQRAHALQQYRAGLRSRAQLCDASFLLRTAARYHGRPAQAGACPICQGDELKDLTWVYGEEIGRHAGSARSQEEIAQWADSGKCFTVHTVEVCPECGWNHILVSRTAGPSTVP